MGVIFMKFDLPIIGFDDCGCCQTGGPDRDGHGEVYGCHEKSTVLTSREEEVLKEIRELSLQAKAIRARLRDLDASADEASRTVLEEELTSLRRRRSDLEAERTAAAEERMHLLGHA